MKTRLLNDLSAAVLGVFVGLLGAIISSIALYALLYFIFMLVASVVLLAAIMRCAYWLSKMEDSSHE